MILNCPECGRNYDDVQQSTICNHPPLGYGADQYCRTHYLLDCFICVDEGLEHCTDCKGTGVRHAVSGHGMIDRYYACNTCKGVGRRKKEPL